MSHHVSRRERYAQLARESLRFIARWIAVYPILGGLTAVLAGIVAFDLLAGFGLPDLFWRQPFWKMLLVGIALAIVFTLVCFVGYLLDSGSDYVRRHRVTPQRYFRRTYPVLTLLVAIGALRVDYEPGTRTPYAHPWVMVLGYGIGVLVVFLTSRFVLPALWRLVQRFVPGLAIRAAVGARTENIPLHGHALVVFLWSGLVYGTLAYLLPSWLPSAVAMCILFAMCILVYGWTVFRVGQYRFLLLVLGVVWIGVVNSRTVFKHRYPRFAAEAYERPAAIPRDGGGPNDALVGDVAAFEAWRKRAATKEQPKPRLVVVATSGGGIRAAVWTGAVLNELSEKIPAFPQHVRVITGASGGMVGASYFAANVGADAPLGDFSAMAADSLEPVARSMALRDLPTLFLPGSYPDRGVALEEAWMRNAPIMKRPYATLAAGEAAGWRPSLIFTPMFVEDGRRAIVSNLDLPYLAENRAPNALYSRGAVQLFRVLPRAQTELPIASIARMNASFPYVSTASELPTKPERHVVDAGYFDNYGVSVSVAWLAHNFDRIVEGTSGVALVQIRDTIQRSFTLADVPRDPGLALAGYGEFLAPLLGALEARNSIMILRNDADVQQIARAFAQRTGDPEFFRSFLVENNEASVLSWALTDSQADRILRYFDDPANEQKDATKAVRALQAWWGRTPATTPAVAKTAVLP